MSRSAKSSYFVFLLLLDGELQYFEMCKLFIFIISLTAFEHTLDSLQCTHSHTSSTAHCTWSVILQVLSLLPKCGHYTLSLTTLGHTFQQLNTQTSLLFIAIKSSAQLLVCSQKKFSKNCMNHFHKLLKTAATLIMQCCSTDF